MVNIMLLITIDKDCVHQNQQIDISIIMMIIKIITIIMIMLIINMIMGRSLVQSIFEGGMATCFAYGQTGSGKFIMISSSIIISIIIIVIIIVIIVIIITIQGRPIRWAGSSTANLKTRRTEFTLLPLGTSSSCSSRQNTKTTTSSSPAATLRSTVGR